MRKGLAFQEGYKGNWERLIKAAPEVLEGSTNKYQVWELVDPEKWVPDGYVCVRVDSRGAGRSPGFIDIWSPREAQDIYHCIEWAGTQPWSSGKVGMNGISYFATNQWQVGALRPPHLAALCIWEGFADYYRELARHGGILSGFTDSWYKRQVLRVQHGVGDNGPRSAVTGEPVAGPETLPADELAKNAADAAGEVARRRLDRRLLSRAHGGVRADRGAAALGRQLGRRRPASARQFRRLSARGLAAEVARGAWRHALHALLQQLRHDAAEALLRPFPQRRGHRLGAGSRGSRSTSAAPAKSSRCAARPNGRSRARSGPSTTCSRTATRSAPTRRRMRRRSPIETTGDGITFLTPPMTAGARSHRPGRGEDLAVVRHHRRRRVPGAARVRSRRQGSHLHRLERSAHAGRPRLAARLAPQARSATRRCRTGPGTPTTRRGRSSRASRSSSTSRSGRPRSWCRRATGSASPCAARTTRSTAATAASPTRCTR